MSAPQLVAVGAVSRPDVVQLVDEVVAGAYPRWVTPRDVVAVVGCPVAEAVRVLHALVATGHLDRWPNRWGDGTATYRAVPAAVPARPAPTGAGS